MKAICGSLKSPCHTIDGSLLSLLAFVLVISTVRCEAQHSKDLVYQSRIVLFVWPDSLELAVRKQQMGDPDFYVAADDENWYRALAFELLDSLGVDHSTVKRKRLKFMVDGAVREYDWSDHPTTWFVVLYDGRREPKLTHSVTLPEDIGFITGE